MTRGVAYGVTRKQPLRMTLYLEQRRNTWNLEEENGSRYPGFCPSRLVKLGGNHYSKRPTWSRRRAPVDRLGLAPCGVCLAALVTSRAVRSYRTFSPLPLRAVYFLWHFPWKFPRPFERHTALWSPEVPPPAPELAGSGYLAATYIIQKPRAFGHGGKKGVKAQFRGVVELGCAG